MTPDETLPSHHIRMLRYTARQLLRPGRVMTDMMVATVLASINNCSAIAEEYEEEMALLRAIRTPPRPRLVPPEEIAHRGPLLSLVTCAPDDGGNAA